jgi:hypothetical protein
MMMDLLPPFLMNSSEFCDPKNSKRNELNREWMRGGG